MGDLARPPCFELWLILHLADSTQDVRTYCVTDKQKRNAPRIKYLYHNLIKLKITYSLWHSVVLCVLCVEKKPSLTPV